MTDDGSSIKQHSRPRQISPLQQRTFPLAKQQPQGMQLNQATASRSSGSSAGLDTAPQPQQPQQQHRQQKQSQQGQQQQQQPLVPNPAQDPTRGLCLAVFPYCCSRNEVLSLTWQMGLSPAALRFVTRVVDADVVLHVKPARKQRHYQYEEVIVGCVLLGHPEAATPTQDLGWVSGQVGVGVVSPLDCPCTCNTM